MSKPDNIFGAHATDDAKPAPKPTKLIDPDRPLLPKVSREQFQRDWLWTALRGIVDHKSHAGNINNALIRSHVEDCLRLIKQTNVQTIEKAWKKYAAR